MKRGEINLARATELMEAGMGSRRASKLLGCHRVTLCRRLHEWGYPLKAGVGGGPKPKVTVDGEDLWQLVQDLGGIRAAAKHFRCRTEAIYDHLHRGPQPIARRYRSTHGGNDVKKTPEPQQIQIHLL